MGHICGGLVASALYSGSRGPDSGPEREHYVVLLNKKLYSHSASLQSGASIGIGEFNAGGYPAMD